MSSLGSAQGKGDGSDLMSGVGATATMVAAARALASRGAQPLLDDRLAEPLVRAVGHEFFTQLMDGEAAFEPGKSQFTQQQALEQTVVRTRYFDKFLLAATKSGIRQVLILAAGLDTRAYRLAWPTSTVVFDVDRPEVVTFKTTILDGLGAQPTADLRALGIDLHDDWPSALQDSGFDPNLPSVWIAEGLLMYLPADAQDRLLDDVTALSAPSSRIATDHIPDMRTLTGERSIPWRQRWRQALGFDVGDLLWNGERNSAGDYLAAKGWQVTLHRNEDLYAANRFQLPDVKTSALIREMSYLSAELP
jgi:methyltransferase (TIGR00027 family)